MECILYRIVKFILYPFYVIIFHPVAIGRENIPKEGKVILAGNHSGQLDAAQMVYGSKRLVHMLAKKELFSNFLSNWFFRSMGGIPVNRKIHDSNAKGAALQILDEDRVLGIFPEGTVNKTIGTPEEVDLLPFKFGAVSFASKSGAPIVPFAICGKYKMFSGKKYIIYGKPYKVGDDLEKENQILMDKVRKLKIKGDILYENEKCRKR